jgi:hypothetical protein
MERADAERTDREPADALRVDACSSCDGGDPAPTRREQQKHTVRRQAAQRGARRVRRRGVEPLHVVDRNEEG